MNGLEMNRKVKQLGRKKIKKGERSKKKLGWRTSVGKKLFTKNKNVAFKNKIVAFIIH